jgi:ppGpp synthetase/RelA/SpoT-type nucleotidyltranferase
MVVPAALTEALGILQPALETLRDYVHDRVRAELAELNPIAIVPRIKRSDSVNQKLQTGRYQALADLDDLVGVKVVLLRRSMIRPAMDITNGAFDAIREVSRPVSPMEFGYREPHIIVRPQVEYLERHEELRSLKAEIQFTTALQHALDTVTHGFDYKGQSFEWQNFRVVAQLRGTLELADSILDNVEASAALMEAGVPAPLDFVDGQTTLDVLAGVFSADAMSPDHRRMATVIVAWLRAINQDATWLRSALEKHGDLVNALSLSCVEAVLGVMLREVGEDLVAAYPGHFCVSVELESLCPQAAVVPQERRVKLTC